MKNFQQRDGQNDGYVWWESWAFLRLKNFVYVLQQIEVVKIFEGVSPDAGDTVGIE